jgi:hypothetical protein
MSASRLSSQKPMDSVVVRVLAASLSALGFVDSTGGSK